MPDKKAPQRVGVVGSGPAGLMAASQLVEAGFEVVVFEKRPSVARKLLIAGSSGLNISNDLPPEKWSASFKGPRSHFEKLFEVLSTASWLAFVQGLGIETFLGTSGRYFVKGLKAAPLVKAWVEDLKTRGVIFRCGEEFVDFESEVSTRPSIRKVLLTLNSGQEHFDAVCLALGGGSYEPEEKPLRWPLVFKNKKIGMEPFTPSNVGFEVDWPAAFIEEAEGLPLKNVVLKSTLGEKQGDLMVTRYGCEGTPVYYVGQLGRLEMDLMPDLSIEKMFQKCLKVKEALSPMRRIKRALALSPAALALVFHCTPQEILGDLQLLLERLKSFPLEFLRCRPLEEAISSAGGIRWEELTEDLMLRKAPGVFVAGEMIDWDAPTGGFLIHGCAAQGRWAAQGIVSYLS